MMIAVVLIASYLIGSISFAWCVAKVHGVDLRSVGSGNLGATNVGRALGGKWFAVVFLLDVFKGAGPTLAATLLPFLSDAPYWLPVACGASAVIGHIFPAFHGFKGGKAVATSLGVVATLAPIPAGIAAGAWIAVWIAGWALFKQKKSDAVGLASVIAAITAPVCQLTFISDPWANSAGPTSALLVILGTLIVVRHGSNLRKLISGEYKQKTDEQN